MRKINFVQQRGEGFVAIGVSDTFAQRSILIYEVRGSVVWPVDGFPGYYLIMGRKKEINEHGKRPLLFLAEGENQSPTLLLKDFSDDIIRLKCSKIYARQDRTVQGIEGFYKDLYRYMKDRNLACAVMPAPSTNDPEYGRALIREHDKDKALDIPRDVDTTLKEQLETITEEEMRESASYAFHAMRYLITGFEKFSDIVQPLFPQNKQAQLEKAQRRWVAFGV